MPPLRPPDAAQVLSTAPPTVFPSGSPQKESLPGAQNFSLSTDSCATIPLTTWSNVASSADRLLLPSPRRYLHVPALFQFFGGFSSVHGCAVPDPRSQSGLRHFVQHRQLRPGRCLLCSRWRLHGPSP